MIVNGTLESTTTTGTGNLTIAAVAGFPRISDSIAIGVPFPYVIQTQDSPPVPRESGIGYLSDANTLVRGASWTWDGTTANSISAAALSLTGEHYVLIGPSAQSCAPPAGHLLSAAPTRYGYLTGQVISAADVRSMVADRLYLSAGLLDRAAVLDALMVSVTTASSSTGALMAGVWQQDASGTARLIAQTGTANPGTTGIKDLAFATDVFLSAGEYVFGVVSNQTAAIAANASALNSTSRMSCLGMSNATRPLPIVTARQDLSGGWSSLPSTLTPTSFGAAGSEFPPMILYRAA
jgi:hypothetical protein